jgi:hypothetical protein
LGRPSALDQIAPQLAVLSDGDTASIFFFTTAVLHGQQPYETVEVIEILKLVDVPDLGDQ